MGLFESQRNSEKGKVLGVDLGLPCVDSRVLFRHFCLGSKVRVQGLGWSKGVWLLGFEFKQQVWNMVHEVCSEMECASTLLQTNMELQGVGLRV